MPSWRLRSSPAKGWAKTGQWRRRSPSRRCWRPEPRSPRRQQPRTHGMLQSRLRRRCCRELQTLCSPRTAPGVPGLPRQFDLGKWNFAPEARGQRRRSAGLSRSPAEMMEGKEEDFLDFICCFLWDPLPFLKAKTFLLDFPQPQRKIDDPFLFFHSHRLHELISQIDEIPESSKTRRSERSSRSKQQVKTSPKRQEIYRKEGGGAAPLGI